MVKPELSIAVPAYNERKNLPGLIEAYRNVKGKVKFQMVIVDNGSSDGTAEYLKKAVKMKDNNFIKVVTVKNNIGYGYGIHQGLLGCDADVIGWSHADMQCPAEDVFKGYNIYKEHTGKVLVMGHRVGRHWKHTLFSTTLQHFASAVLVKRFDDLNAQPKIFDKGLLKSFRNLPLEFSFDLYVQYRAKQMGYNVVSFDVSFLRRAHGESKGADVSVLKKIPAIKHFVAEVGRMRLGKYR